MEENPRNSSNLPEKKVSLVKKIWRFVIGNFFTAATDTIPFPITSKEASHPHFWKELLKLVLLALIIVVPFRLYVAQPFIVDGASMDPTFEDGEYLIVDELSYRFKEPQRGEVLIFKYPKDPSKYFIKRIIGLPGETININNGEVVIFNDEHPEGLALVEPYVVLEKNEDSSFILDKEEYFVLGDNRLQSADSRLWGAVPRENIVGRPIVRFIPPALFPGAMAYEENNSN